MSEATLIFPNMRGGCATVGQTVHALFRVNGRRLGASELSRSAPATELADKKTELGRVASSNTRSVTSE